MYKSFKTYEELMELVGDASYNLRGFTLDKIEWLRINPITKSKELRYFYCDHAKAEVLFKRADGVLIYHCKKCKSSWHKDRQHPPSVGLKAVNKSKQNSI
jgi:hypothetical protein